MKKFVSLATNENSTLFYAINDIVSVKFYTQNELTMELTTKSHGIETFGFSNIEDYQYAMETFQDL